MVKTKKIHIIFFFTVRVMCVRACVRAYCVCRSQNCLFDLSSVALGHHIHFDLPRLGETGGLLLVDGEGNPLRHCLDESVALVARHIVEVFVGDDFFANVFGLREEEREAVWRLCERSQKPTTSEYHRKHRL